jgi:hypothetical protein
MNRSALGQAAGQLTTALELLGTQPVSLERDRTEIALRFSLAFSLIFTVSGAFVATATISHLSFPFSSEARFSRSIPKPVLSSCRLYTDCRRVRKQVSPRLVPEHLVGSGFDSTL